VLQTGIMDGKSKKIFIQRDYSRGTAVRFATDFPRELTGKVNANSAPNCVFTFTQGCSVEFMDGCY